MEIIKYIKTLDVHKNGVQFTLQGFETSDNLSRRIEISLMSSGDTVDLPLGGIVAMMYVTTPSAADPSINKCIVKDNKIIYDVLPIVEEGITTMQLKIISTNVEGAESVLVAPKFAVEVSKSDTDDEGAEQTKTFTALEEAVARANGVYEARLKGIEIDSQLMFRAYYEDGTTYESDAIKNGLLIGNSLLSKSYAVGDTNVRDNEDQDNSMYYSNVSRSASAEAKYVSEQANELLAEARKHGVYTTFDVDFSTGKLKYESPSYVFSINSDGELVATGLAYSLSDIEEYEASSSGNASAGRVLLIPKGNYDSTATYEMLDMVNHNGVSWVAKKTVTGIEPNDKNSEFWYNLLQIEEVVSKAVSSTVAPEVATLLTDKFREQLSEARYVTDLMADYAEATFVRWDSDTENTPYKASLTECTEGFAHVFGSSADNHTIIAWTKTGENFTHSITGGAAVGWDGYIPKSGGTMTGPLSFVGGKASVSGDSNGAFLQATKDADNYRRIIVEVPSSGELSQAAKIVSKANGTVKEHNLFGEHNLELLNTAGFPRIATGKYVGTGTYGAISPNALTFPFKPKVVFLQCSEALEPYFSSPYKMYFQNPRYRPLIYGCPITYCEYEDSNTNFATPSNVKAVCLKWSENTVSWYSNLYNDAPDAYIQLNAEGITYHYVALG